MSRAILSLVLLLAGGCYWIDEEPSFTFYNRSSLVITELRMLPMGDARWGPDLVAGTLEPGEALAVPEMECDAFDLRVVIEGGGTCVFDNLWLCDADLNWNFYDWMMADCEWDTR
jgi:hypothetical protein